MLQVMAWALRSCWKSSLVCRLPSSEWCISALGLPRRHSAISKAALTILAWMVSLMDQPAMRREYRSITAAAYSQPSAVQM
jgi:hypothetical protein